MAKVKLTKNRDSVVFTWRLLPTAKPGVNGCRETLFNLEMSTAGWLQLKFNHDTHNNQRMSTGK
jgi:hypothetical protein